MSRSVWLFLLLCSGACTGITSLPDQALSVELTATPETAGVGVPITFRFSARGNSLEGVSLEYGDGAGESIATYLSRTAAGTYSHGYGDAGDYQVRVTVLETGGLAASDSVLVHVTQAGAPRRPVLTSARSRVY